MRLCCAPQHCCVPDALASRGRRRRTSSAARSVGGIDFPVASDARLAGDAKQTRFILDLDKQDRASRLRAGRSLSGRGRPAAGHFPACRRASATRGRGLIKAFRYGLVMPGGSRIVLDLDRAGEDRQGLCAGCRQRPAAAAGARTRSGRPHRLRAVAGGRESPELRPAIAEANAAVAGRTHPPRPARAAADPRPVVVIDPGHGGIDNGTQAGGGEHGKEPGARFRAGAARPHREGRQIPRGDDPRPTTPSFRSASACKIARNQSAALFVSIHADALPRGEGDAQGATIYTLSDNASDAEAERLAEAENKADAIGGVNLTEEPTEVADILIDLAQRETKTFSNRFARMLDGRDEERRADAQASAEIGRLPGAEGAGRAVGAGRTRLCLEQGRPASNWCRKAGGHKTVGSVAQAIDAFLRQAAWSGRPMKSRPQRESRLKSVPCGSSPSLATATAV